MTAAAARAPTVERLARDLFDAIPTDPLAEEVAEWLAGSRRFRAFAEAHRDKIRKKLRGATDSGARRDVRLELLTAHRLLADRRIMLGFETYGSGRVGPDFTVAYRGTASFNLEVTRLRGAPTEAAFIGSVLVKLRQLPPSMANALLIAIEGTSALDLDVGSATRELRARADRHEEPFFVGRRFDSTRDFHRRFMRLGAVIVACDGAPGDARASLWVNREARIAVPERALRAAVAAIGAA
jgi:hypothetical protein